MVSDLLPQKSRQINDSTTIPTHTTTSERKPCVLVIDDHPAIREALADTINGNADLKLCGLADSAEQALKLARETQPDVAIIDIDLAGTNGLDVVQDLQALYPDLQVVVFSMYDESIYAERASQAGAAAYVMKSEPTQSVIEAISAAAQGRFYFSQRMAPRIITDTSTDHSRGPEFPPDKLYSVWS